MYDIHENMFLTAFIMWLLYFIERGAGVKNWVGVWIFAMLVCSVKENTPLYVAIIALYILFKKQGKASKINGIMLLLLSLSYFGFAIWLIDNYGDGMLTGWRLGYAFSEDGNMFGVIMNVILNPVYVLKEIFTVNTDGDLWHDRILYMIRMLLPLSMLPLINKKAANLILFIPCILMNLVPSWPYHHNVNFQYNFGVCAIFFYLFVENFSTLKPKSVKIKKFVLIFGMTASVFLFTAEMIGRSENVFNYLRNRDEHVAVQETFAVIDKTKSVSAASYFIAHLYQVKELYEVRDDTHTTDYVVLDLRFHDHIELVPKYEERGYRIVTSITGKIAIMEKP